MIKYALLTLQVIVLDDKLQLEQYVESLVYNMATTKTSLYGSYLTCHRHHN